MIKVKNRRDFGHLFECYTHNIPVIYASLNGQYNGELYVDNEKHPTVAILFTPFDFHYIVGKLTDKNLKWLNKVIFDEYLSENKKKEGVFFTPNDLWDKALGKIFSKHNGIKDQRCIYKMMPDKYNAFKRNYVALEDIEVIIKESKEGAHLAYPICEIYKNHERVSFCSGFMLAKGRAEIMVETKEAYRKNGYALEAAHHLIKYLISKDIEPDWCCWPVREASKMMAEKLGFEMIQEVPVHVWLEARDE